MSLVQPPDLAVDQSIQLLRHLSISLLNFLQGSDCIPQTPKSSQILFLNGEHEGKVLLGQKEVFGAPKGVIDLSDSVGDMDVIRELDEHLFIAVKRFLEAEKLLKKIRNF